MATMAFRGSTKSKVRPMPEGLDAVVAQPAPLSARSRPASMGISTRFRQMLSAGKAPTGQAAVGGGHGSHSGGHSHRGGQGEGSLQGRAFVSEGGGCMTMVGSSITKMPISARSSVSTDCSVTSPNSASMGRALSKSSACSNSFEVRSTTKDSCVSSIASSEENSMEVRRSMTSPSGARPGRTMSKESTASSAIPEQEASRDARGAAIGRSSAVRSVFSDNDTAEPRSLNTGRKSTHDRAITLTSIDENILPLPKRSMSLGVSGHAPLVIPPQPARAHTKGSSGRPLEGRRTPSKGVPQPVVHQPPEDDGSSSGSDDEEDEWLQYSRNGVWHPSYMPGDNDHLESPTTAASSNCSSNGGSPAKLTSMERFRLRLLKKHGFLETPRDVRIKQRGPRV